MSTDRFVLCIAVDAKSDELIEFVEACKRLGIVKSPDGPEMRMEDITFLCVG